MAFGLSEFTFILASIWVAWACLIHLVSHFVCSNDMKRANVNSKAPLVCGKLQISN